MLVTDIDCYVKYLQSEAGFFISLQPSRQEAVVNNNLMHYDMHANPYCIYIKTEQARWERCIQHHESIFAKQKKEPCFCMCPAGVWEYAYPVYHGEEKMAVIYVSGYCADAPKGDAALRSYCRDTAMDYKSTKAVYTQYITQNIPDIKKNQYADSSAASHAGAGLCGLPRYAAARYTVCGGAVLFKRKSYRIDYRCGHQSAFSLQPFYHQPYF